MITIKDFIENKDKLSRDRTVNVDSVFIQNGNSIEKHFFIQEKLHKMRSTSKIVVAMAVGIAIANKMKINGKPITLETKIYPTIKHLVEVNNINNLSKIKQWTIWNLLTHSTGYETQIMSDGFVQKMDKSQVLNYALNYDIPFEVGTRYAYNNAEPFILSVLFQESFSINLSDFVNDKIFKKLEIEEYKWENYGKYCIGASGLYLKHSDFHKLGQLLLNESHYNTVQVVPLDWIKQMCSTQIISTTAYKPERVLPKIGGGFFTFISRDGFVFRDGADGQYIILNKEQNLLITIMATEPEMKYISEILRDLIYQLLNKVLSELVN